LEKKLMNTKPDIILWGLIGCALGTILAVLVLPGWIPALTASITGGTVYWLLARAGGFVAYGLLWLAVVFGLLMTGKVARHWPGTRQANAIHQSVSVLAVVYTVFHALILLGDRYIGFNLLGLLLPFTSGYAPLWVGLGQIGLYLLVAITLSYYIRKRIGRKTWRALHYGSFILYLLVTAHGLLAGTDTSAPWALAFYTGTSLITYALTVYRILVTIQSRRGAKSNLPLAAGDGI
jgi:predicted ferric reductase